MTTDADYVANATSEERKTIFLLSIGRSKPNELDHVLDPKL